MSRTVCNRTSAASVALPSVALCCSVHVPLQEARSTRTRKLVLPVAFPSFLANSWRNGYVWVMRLKDALGLGRGEMVALIGAGGKTTTLFRLAKEFWEDGGKVLVTTTTKMFKPAKPHVHRLYVVKEVDALLGEIGKIHEPVIVGAGGGVEATKLVGLPPEWLDTVAQKAGLDAVLVEADGAAMRSFKVPAEHEPVVPMESSLTIWVMGIKVLGQPLTSDWVHRAERAVDLLSVSLGETVTEKLILRLVEHPIGCLRGIPSKSRKVALINQADSAEEVEKARSLAQALVGHGLERIVITSYLDKDAVKEVIQSEKATGSRQ